MLNRRYLSLFLCAALSGAALGSSSIAEAKHTRLHAVTSCVQTNPLPNNVASFAHSGVWALNGGQFTCSLPDTDYLFHPDVFEVFVDWTSYSANDVAQPCMDSPDGVSSHCDLQYRGSGQGHQTVGMFYPWGWGTAVNNYDYWWYPSVSVGFTSAGGRIQGISSRSYQ